MKHCTAILAGGLIVAACSVSRPPEEEPDSRRLTAGTVQREIRKGMTGSEVVEALGSPNIVTGGPGGTETWVYDRTFTEVTSSSAGTGVWFVVGVTNLNEDVRRSTQATLTVVVKFDADRRVSDVAYHQSRF